MRCPRCGATILAPATTCDCGTAGKAKPAEATSPATTPASAPPPAAPPSPRMIPTKNVPALVGYYLGIFSLIPYVMFLALPAVVLGWMGLAKAKSVGQGKWHAVTAIAAGIVAVAWGTLFFGWWRLPFANPFTAK